MAEGTLVGGKYRLRARIGEGAMGVVWSAVNEATDRPVAIKLVANAHSSNDELRTRMLREARACGRIVHKNVVEIFDAGQTESGAPYLVMPLLAGESLASLLDRIHTVPQGHAIRMALEIAKGLGAAHAAGIVHRDLKPANIFLAREADELLPTIKILDFGVSKLLDTSQIQPSETVTGGVLGSPLYMSPEQAVGSKAIDQRSDLWTLGVVLYRMLIGEPPFDGDSVFVVASKILSGPIPVLANAAPQLDQWVSDLVAQCLVRDVNQRIQTANAFSTFIRQHNDASFPLPPLDSVTKIMPGAPFHRRRPATVPAASPTGPQLPHANTVPATPAVPAVPESNPDLFGKYRTLDAPVGATTTAPFINAGGVSGHPLPSTTSSTQNGRRRRKQRSLWIGAIAVVVGAALGLSVLFVVWSQPSMSSSSTKTVAAAAATSVEPLPSSSALVAASSSDTSGTGLTGTTLIGDAPASSSSVATTSPSAATSRSTVIPGTTAKPKPHPKPRSSSSSVPFEDPG